MSGSNLSPAERRLRGQLGAAAMHARNDVHQTTRAGREAFDQRFITQARELAGPGASEDEVQRRAKHLRSAHFAAMALKSAKVRRLRAEADLLEAEVQDGAA